MSHGDGVFAELQAVWLMTDDGSSGPVPSSSPPLVRWVHVPSKCSCRKPSTWPNSWMIVFWLGDPLAYDTVVWALDPGKPRMSVDPRMPAPRFVLIWTATEPPGIDDGHVPHPEKSRFASRPHVSVMLRRIVSCCAVVNPDTKHTGMNPFHLVIDVLIHSGCDASEVARSSMRSSSLLIAHAPSAINSDAPAARSALNLRVS